MVGIKSSTIVMLAGVVLVLGAVVVASKLISPRWVERQLFYGEYEPEPWTTKNVIASARVGDAIIQAAERYRADLGIYPPSLEPLVPDYINKIPAPPTGDSVLGENPWSYRFLRDPEFPSVTSFELSISNGTDNLMMGAGVLQSLRYDSDIGVWSMTRVTIHGRWERTIERWPLDRDAVDALEPPPDREVHYIDGSGQPTEIDDDGLRF